MYFYRVINVTIIGTGNVAFHLSEVFFKHQEINLVEICGRKKNLPTEFNDFIDYNNNIFKLKKSDFYIICVSDEHIETISKNLNIDNNSTVLHCSGSTHINELSNHYSYGVFYPLQTFSKNKKVDFTQIPFCLEATTEKDEKLLEKLAGFLSKKIYYISSEQRKAIHVAAVFANNFTNHMYKIAHDICNTHQIPIEILNPLINETAEKIKVLPPALAQTGPAIRKDVATIKNHLFLLTEKQQEIYTILTKSIQNDT